VLAQSTSNSTSTSLPFALIDDSMVVLFGKVSSLPALPAGSFNRLINVPGPIFRGLIDRSALARAKKREKAVPPELVALLKVGICLKTRHCSRFLPTGFAVQHSKGKAKTTCLISTVCHLA
jgi:hypothetical protein